MKEAPNTIKHAPIIKPWASPIKMKSLRIMTQVTDIKEQAPHLVKLALCIIKNAVDIKMWGIRRQLRCSLRCARFRGHFASYRAKKALVSLTQSSQTYLRDWQGLPTFCWILSSFRPWNLSKIHFWICRKDHTEILLWSFRGLPRIPVPGCLFYLTSE